MKDLKKRISNPICPLCRGYIDFILQEQAENGMKFMCVSCEIRIEITEKENDRP